METLKKVFDRLRNWEYSLPCLIVIIILVMHFSVIMQPNEPLFDEIHYVEDARVIISGEGTQRPEHPPMAKLFIVGGIKLFGDNPFGWRFFPSFSALPVSYSCILSAAVSTFQKGIVSGGFPDGAGEPELYNGRHRHAGYL